MTTVRKITKDLCHLTVAITLALPQSVFAAKTVESNRPRWQATTPTVSDSVQAIWNGNIPSSRMDEANGLEINDLKSYQEAIQGALGEVSMQELAIGRSIEPGELAVKNSRLEILLNRSEGLAIGSDLRLKGFLKALQGSKRKFNKSQYVGMAQLFLMKEWMIVHSVVHARTLQKAIENPADQENEAKLLQASKQLTEFLDSAAQAVEEVTIANTQSLLDSLPNDGSDQLRIALGLSYGQLQEIEASLAKLKDFDPNPDLKTLVKNYNQKLSKVTNERDFDLTEPIKLTTEMIFNPLGAVLGLIAILTKNTGNFVLGIGTVYGIMVGGYILIYGSDYIRGVINDSYATKMKRITQKQELLEKHHQDRKQIINQFLLMGQSAYTCSDILQPASDNQLF